MVFTNYCTNNNFNQLFRKEAKASTFLVSGVHTVKIKFKLKNVAKTEYVTNPKPDELFSYVYKCKFAIKSGTVLSLGIIGNHRSRVSYLYLGGTQMNWFVQQMFKRD